MSAVLWAKWYGVVRLLMDHQQMIADRIELIHVQPGLERFRQSLVQLDVENLETQTLRLPDFLIAGGQAAGVNIATAGGRKNAVSDAGIA